jgi:hypothetical protein
VARGPETPIGGSLHSVDGFATGRNASFRRAVDAALHLYTHARISICERQVCALAHANAVKMRIV